MNNSEKNTDCGCVIHPGETHEEHMDRFDREKNEALLKRAVENIKTATSYGQLAHARALLHSACSAEILRLQDKERNLLAGKIRVKK